MFRPLKEYADSDLQQYVIANSQTIAVGDAVQGSAAASSLFVTGAASTTGAILGVVISIVGPNGQVLEKDTVTVASNNQTVGLIYANILPLFNGMTFEADLSAASGTTTGSAGVGSFSLYSTNGTLDESTYVAGTSAITKKQFCSYGISQAVMPGGSASKVVGHFNQALAF